MQKILIADDEANILMLLEIMLRDLNVDIISAENGESAIELAKKERPDLIISDVVMPKKMDLKYVEKFEMKKKLKIRLLYYCLL